MVAETRQTQVAASKRVAMKWDDGKPHPYEQISLEKMGKSGKYVAPRCIVCNRDAGCRELIARYFSANLCWPCAKQARQAWASSVRKVDDPDAWESRDREPSI